MAPATDQHTDPTGTDPPFQHGACQDPPMSPPAPALRHERNGNPRPIRPDKPDLTTDLISDLQTATTPPAAPPC